MPHVPSFPSTSSVASATASSSSPSPTPHPSSQLYFSFHFVQISSCHALQHRLVLNVLIRLFESPTPLDTLVEVRVFLLLFFVLFSSSAINVEAEQHNSLVM